MTLCVNEKHMNYWVNEECVVVVGCGVCVLCVVLHEASEKKLIESNEEFRSLSLPSHILSFRFSFLSFRAITINTIYSIE